MPKHFELVAVADEGLMLRCPDCGENFLYDVNSPAAVIACPDCLADAEADLDPIDDGDDIDPVNAWEDDAYAEACELDPYAGTYSEE